MNPTSDDRPSARRRLRGGRVLAAIALLSAAPGASSNAQPAPKPGPAPVSPLDAPYRGMDGRVIQISRTALPPGEAAAVEAALRKKDPTLFGLDDALVARLGQYMAFDYGPWLGQPSSATLGDLLRTEQAAAGSLAALLDRAGGRMRDGALAAPPFDMTEFAATMRQLVRDDALSARDAGGALGWRCTSDSPDDGFYTTRAPDGVRPPVDQVAVLIGLRGKLAAPSGAAPVGGPAGMASAYKEWERFYRNYRYGPGRGKRPLRVELENSSVRETPDHLARRSFGLFTYAGGPLNAFEGECRADMLELLDTENWVLRNLYQRVDGSAVREMTGSDHVWVLRGSDHGVVCLLHATTLRLDPADKVAGTTPRQTWGAVKFPMESRVAP